MNSATLTSEEHSASTPTNRLLRAPEVARILGVSNSHAYKLAQNGVIPTVRIGRSLRVPERAIHRWIEQNTTTPDISG